jgi:HK97 family phage major capsid protein
MATALERENEARQALALAKQALEDGDQDRYKTAWADYSEKLESSRQLRELADAEKQMQRDPEKDGKPSDLRDPKDADWVPGTQDNESPLVKQADGVVLKGGDGRPEFVPYATPNREGWIKSYPVSVQHPSIIKRLTPDMQAKKALEEEAFARYLRFGDAGFRGEHEKLAAHLKDLQEGADTEGGYLVPTDQRVDIIVDPNSPGGVTRPISRTFTTTRDGGTWPALNGDTSFVAIAEEATGPESDPTFAQVPFTIRKVGRNVDLSVELLQDSAVNLPVFLGGLFNRAKGRYEDQQAVEGDGTTEPLGLRTTGATQGDVSDITDLLTLAGLTVGEVFAAYFELPAQFRAGATWHTTSSFMGLLAGIESSNGAIAFNRELFAGPNMQLLGRPVVMWDGTGWDDGAAVAANEEVGAFGNFGEYYYFVDRVGMTVERDNSVAFRTDQVVFRARARYDSFFADPAAFLILKGAAS